MQTAKEKLAFLSTSQVQNNLGKDFQVDAVYEAEHLTANGYGEQEQFYLPEAQELITQIQTSDWMHKHYPAYANAEPTQVGVNSDWFAEMFGYMGGTQLHTGKILSPSSKYLTKHSILHEISHAIQLAEYGQKMLAQYNLNRVNYTPTKVPCNDRT